MSQLSIKNLYVNVGGKAILKDFSLEVASGEVHAIMGPNGCGKSTLAHALTGRPGYEVVSGHAFLDGVDLLELATYERARHGLLLAMQQPLDVPGVLPVELLEAAGASGDVRSRMMQEAELVGLRSALLDRFVNVDLSGGERKRAEVVQVGVLQPKFVLLDEIDSGLDVDALSLVGQRVQRATNEWNCGVIAITHFSRLLHELPPSKIHVMDDGHIVATGGPELAEELEKNGYEPFRSSATSI